MEMNDQDVFHLEHCFVCYSAPALAAFPSILLIIVFSTSFLPIPTLLFFLSCHCC